MSIARKSAFDATAQIATVCFSLVSSIFISRFLGAEGRGIYVLSTIIAHGLLLNFIGFGMGTTFQVFAARERDRLPELHASGILFSLLVGLVAGALLIVFAPLVQSTLFKGMPWLYLAILAGTLPFTIYFMLWRGMMNGIGAIRRRAAFDVAYSFAHSVSIISILLLMKSQPTTVLVGVYYAIIVFSGIVMIGMMARVDRLWANPQRDLVRRLFSYGKWIYAGGMAAQLRFQIDQIMVNFAGAAAVLGVYNQAAGLASRAMLPSEALQAASYNPISNSELRESARLVVTAFRQMLAVGIAITAIGWIAAPLIPIIYGSDFAASVWPFRVLLPSICLAAASRMIFIYYNGALVRPQMATLLNWITVIVQITLSLWLSKIIGPLQGITLGTAASFYLVSILAIATFAARKETPRLVDFILFTKDDWKSWRRIIRRD